MFKFKILIFVSILFSTALANAAKLRGTVVAAEDGSPLPGASITIKELPNQGVEVEEDGTYKIEVPSGKYTVVCELVGFTTLTKSVNVKQEAKLNFKLESDVEDLG